MYTSKLARFTSRDPLPMGEALLGGLPPNTYMYADNNPTMLTDPSGLAPIIIPPINKGKVKTFPNCARPMTRPDLPPGWPLCTKVGATWEWYSKDCPCWSTADRGLSTTSRVLSCVAGLAGIIYQSGLCRGTCTKVGTYKCKAKFKSVGKVLVPFSMWHRLNEAPCITNCKCKF